MTNWASLKQIFTKHTDRVSVQLVSREKYKDSNTCIGFPSPYKSYVRESVKCNEK